MFAHWHYFVHIYSVAIHIMPYHVKGFYHAFPNTVPGHSAVMM